MKTSDAGRGFIKAFEVLKLTPYRDQAGKWTVGWGHVLLDGEPADRAWTVAECEAAFESDLGYVEDVVNECNVPLEQQEFDACAALTYNIGVNGFRGSTVLRLLNAGEHDRAALAFLMWIKVTDPRTHEKKRSRGLMARRAAELLIFTNGDYEAEYM